jgi:hypothetical protein
MICMICHDTPCELLKICQCNESLVCKSCLKKLNKEKTESCPICRTLLRIEIKFNKKKFARQIFNFIFFLVLILLVQIYPVLEFIDKIDTINNTSLLYNKSFQHFTVLSSTFILEPITILYINNFMINRSLTRFLNKDTILYLVLVTISSFIFALVIITSDIDHNFFVYYIACVCVPFYFLPFGIMLMKLISGYIFNVKDIMVEESFDNIIKENEIVSI